VKTIKNIVLTGGVVLAAAILLLSPPVVKLAKAQSDSPREPIVIIFDGPGCSPCHF